MKKVVIILAVCFLSVAVNAAMDWDIYNDATIEDGDVYGTVNIYDTPPDQTLVEMLGGDISTCTINDSALLNYNGGDISVLKQYDFSISYIDSVDIPTMYLYGESQSHIHNGSFGPSIFLYDDAKVHIYGYNFDYDEIASPNLLNGQWENGEDFSIVLRNSFSYNPNQVVLHEVPEPISLLLLGFGSVFLKKIHF